MDEEKIVLTKSELRQIVKEAIKENLQEAPAKITSANLFKDLSMKLTAEIIELNREYNQRSYASRGIQDSIWASWGNLHQFPSDIHEGIRKTVLSILGVAFNKEVMPNEYEFARSIYQKLADVAVQSYEKRLEIKVNGNENQ